MRTQSGNPDFLMLCTELDAELKSRYGLEQAPYNKLNVITDNHTTIVGYLNKTPAACECFKINDDDFTEIKRIFPEPECRGNGLSIDILGVPAIWAKELGYATAPSLRIP